MIQNIRIGENKNTNHASESSNAIIDTINPANPTPLFCPFIERAPNIRPIIEETIV